MTPRNPLAESGKPLFFRVRRDDAVRLLPPVIRLGDAVRVVARSLSVMQKEALVTSARTGDTWRLASDEGAYLAGLDEAPCPLSFLTVGMVCSTLNELLALAAQRNIQLTGVRLVQDNFYTMTGAMADGSMRGGAQDVRLEAQLSADASEAALVKLVQDAILASPVNGLLRDSMPSYFSLAHNGMQVGVPAERSLATDPALEDPAPLFDGSHPHDSHPGPLIRRGGMTPLMTHSVTRANDSLAAVQNRLLHVRGICTLRDDGVRQVEAQLFNPHGSVFHFLSDEAEGFGGHSRALDALGYASAGIAFCFMTQFGRYASIMKRSLASYRVVQDTHFSLGGATGATGVAGHAGPVETSVFLDSTEDDSCAAQMLAMAEQTCFLHALCKATVRTRVVVRPYSTSPDPVVVELPIASVPGQ